MKLLDAVNEIMPKLGNAPVTELDARHPTLAVLLPILDSTRKSILGVGWWFNQFEYTAHPDPDGLIRLGSTALSFIPHRPDTAVQRGKLLYNPITLNTTFTEPVKGTVIFDVDFEDLPETAANYILNSALCDAFTTDIGASQELSLWAQKAASAHTELFTEHLRQKKYSTRRSKRWGRLTSALWS